MIQWTRIRLHIWGRWARGGLPGLPTESPMLRWHTGDRGYESSEMPTDIAEVDHAVCIAPPKEKSVLIVFYCQHGPLTEKAARLAMDRWTFKRALARAESFVDQNL